MHSAIRLLGIGGGGTHPTQCVIEPLQADRSKAALKAIGRDFMGNLVADGDDLSLDAGADTLVIFGDFGVLLGNSLGLFDAALQVLC